MYGDLAITILDEQLEAKGQVRCNSDNGFVLHKRKKPFKVNDDSIELYDWDDNFYKIDCNGNVIIKLAVKNSCT